MFLKRISYKELIGKPEEWSINDVILSKESLIVGSNATGKTRCINIITALAHLLSGKSQHIINGIWNCEFEKDDNKYKYYLEIENKKIKKEELILGRKKLINRSMSGSYIHAFKNGTGKSIRNQYYPPEDKITITVQRDKKHFPFLEELHDWAANFYAYTFSAVRPNDIVVPGSYEGILQTLSSVSYLLIETLEKPNNTIPNQIMDDLRIVGYDIDKILVTKKMIANMAPNIFISSLKEKDLKCNTEQTIMSAGMFRAFSILAIVNYLIAEKKTGTIVIDDLGEGLDFERSSRLTELIFSKIEQSPMHLIVSTNDRFLMNKVPIKNWNILEREGHSVKAYNYNNSKKIFDDFKYTGLNNFDFLAYNFLHEEVEED